MPASILRSSSALVATLMIASLVLAPAAAHASTVKVQGVINVQVGSPQSGPWVVESASPVWEAVPLFGCTTTLEAIFQFFNECTLNQDVEYCYKTVCRLPDFSHFGGGFNTTTEFSDGCFYCIEHPECCGIGYDLPGPEWGEIDETVITLSGSGNVPIALDYLLTAPDPLTEPGQQTSFEGSRSLEFSFLRPPGTQGPAGLLLPIDLEQIVVDAWAGTPSAISNGFAKLQLTIESPQLGTLLSTTIDQPVNGPANISGNIPAGAFEQSPAQTISNGLLFTPPMFPVPPALNRVDVKVTLSYEGEASLTDTTGCDPWVRGDYTGDGIFNIGDLIGLLGVLFGVNPEPDPAEIADLNGDGSANIADIIGGLQFLFADGPPPAPPFPEPGCP